MRGSGIWCYVVRCPRCHALNVIDAAPSPEEYSAWSSNSVTIECPCGIQTTHSAQDVFRFERVATHDNSP